MNIRDFRKNIFINSQYCTYYIDKKQTVAAGIMRSRGYKFNEILTDEQIGELDKLYRKYTTILNCAVGVEIVLYLYCIFIPFFLQFLHMQYFLAVILFSLPPLIALFFTYIGINGLYEKDLQKFGQYQKVQFKPNVYNVEPKAFDNYLSVKRKSVFILIPMVLLFAYLLFTPLVIDGLNSAGKYNSVIKMSNVYLKFVPIISDIYAQRAYAFYKTGNYESAVKDFEMANKYSNSDSFDYDILGSKIAPLNYENALVEIDKAYSSAENDTEKRYLTYIKAIILQKNNKLQDALKIYNEFVHLYEKNIDSGFAIDAVYGYRSQIRKALGDIEGAKADKEIANNMCPECNFDLDVDLVRQP